MVVCFAQSSDKSWRCREWFCHSAHSTRGGSVWKICMQHLCVVSIEFISFFLDFFFFFFFSFFFFSCFFLFFFFCFFSGGYWFVPPFFILFVFCLVCVFVLYSMSVYVYSHTICNGSSGLLQQFSVQKELSFHVSYTYVVIKYFCLTRHKHSTHVSLHEKDLAIMS